MEQSNGAPGAPGVGSMGLSPEPEQPGGTTLKLSGDLVVAHAERIRATLLAALEQHRDVFIDCSQATDADVSFLQILIAAQCTASGWGKTFGLVASSRAVETAIESGGFLRDAIPRGLPSVFS